MLNHTIYGDLLLQLGGIQVYHDGRNVNLVQGSRYVVVENADLGEVIETLQMAYVANEKNKPGA
jgi:hypothetical protein